MNLCVEVFALEAIHGTFHVRGILTGGFIPCNIVVCQSWLSADLGFGSVSVCVCVCLSVCVSVLTGIELCKERHQLDR